MEIPLEDCAHNPMIYLDNAATTAPDERVVEAMLPFLRDSWGNPSALHALGARARAAVNAAREAVALALGCAAAEVVFTSGGTEADNLALRGAAEVTGGRHVVLSAIEHEAVIGNRAWLERRGFEVTLAPCGPSGIVNPDALADLLHDQTALVAVMHVNNETGTVQPIEAIAARVRRRSPRALILVDAVQSFGRLPLSLQRSGVDLLAVSAHKIHGPKGVGALVVRRENRLHPIMAGGGQEGGLRSGTENVPGIVGFGVAATLAMARLREDVPRIAALRRRLEEGALAIAGATLNGDPERRACHIASVRFPGARSETLLHLLEARGIYASAGSACHATTRAPSHVLRAMGIEGDQGTVRFSLGRATTEAEILSTIEVLRDVVPEARSLRDI